MDEPNQGPSALPPGTEPLPSPPLDLRFWLLLVGIAGLGALLLRQGELAALVAVAGLFAVSHAADLEPAYRPLYRAVAWMVPFLSILTFATLANILFLGGPSGSARTIGLIFAAIGIFAIAATAFTPVAAAMARWMFGVPHPSSTLRLAARLALIGGLLYPVVSVAFPTLMDSVTGDGAPLVGKESLWGNLIGLAIVALGGVGFRVRRDFHASIDRLGLRLVEPRHWIVIGVGVAALVVLNAGAELLQRTWLPELWASDQRVIRMITRDLSRWDMLLLGLSAGFGEEIALRGALQPKLGMFFTSLVFALLHVQYSWFGALIIFVLGLVLGMIRRRTSTTAAILVHSIYDIFAVFTIQP